MHMQQLNTQSGAPMQGPVCERPCIQASLFRSPVSLHAILHYLALILGLVTSSAHIHGLTPLIAGDLLLPLKGWHIDCVMQVLQHKCFWSAAGTSSHNAQRLHQLFHTTFCARSCLLGLYPLTLS
jgi:hypothetical protein